MTYQELGICLTEWCTFRQADIKRMWPLPGGWEGWAQADFAAVTMANHPGVEVKREIVIGLNTGSEKKVDLLIADIAVELKCQSKNNSERFVPGLMIDIGRLREYQTYNDFAGIQTVSVGIAFDQAGYDYMKASGFDFIQVQGGNIINNDPNIINGDFVCGVLLVARPVNAPVYDFPFGSSRSGFIRQPGI